jgi:hypothetical protein
MRDLHRWNNPKARDGPRATGDTRRVAGFDAGHVPASKPQMLE